jgi:sugar lactone lactonase YvrE
VAIDAYNTKWIVSGLSTPPGLYFFNENNTINEPGDDVYGIYYTSEMGINDVTDVIIDKNNEVWFTTNNGVFIINNPLAAIQNPQQKPAPIKLGIISGGLKVPFTENCRCISTDILNQKWIGTESNGVFHLSEDGSTLIEQFNTTNSPIADNRINGIVVSPISGKAYFATLKGLSVTTTDAIKPIEEFDKITCSPNPYLVPNNIALKIDGLVENSSVKIITLSGEVIREFDSPGGRIATWDGLDLKGNIVPSGIYIVVAFNKDGSKVGKGKIAVVKK